MSHLESLVPNDVVRATERHLQAVRITEKLSRPLSPGKREKLVWLLSWLNRKDSQPKIIAIPSRVQSPRWVIARSSKPLIGPHLFALSPFKRMPEGKEMRSHPDHR